ncbi:MAG TPA: CHAT domain-containing protein [Oscillatoriaceae cyanobacterium M33_DOE_052]|uniref:CHAT domain-containing protein n=1 Tax=Planktothricoides sp. SpSt-374 TaxID=2282167 RepID=A0A7C3ZFJ2_9CYAN|nr:CHAT domain-containing protein [Oscillatoriaceae cyanobacterium M33_DOE_052]
MKLLKSVSKPIFLFCLSLLLTVVIPIATVAVTPPGSRVVAPTANLPLVAQAKQLYDAGRFLEAVPLLQQAASEFEARGDYLNQAMALSNLAAAVGQLQQWDAAEVAVNNSISLLVSQPSSGEKSRILAQTRDIQGKLQMERGRLPEALAAWQEAAKLYGELDAKDQWMQAQIHQSRALQGLGLYPRACETLLGALTGESLTCDVDAGDVSALQQRLQNQALRLPMVRAINDLGNVLRVLGQLEASEQVLSLGLEAVQKLNMPEEEAKLYLNLGNTTRAVANQPTVEAVERLELGQKAVGLYQKAAQMAGNSPIQMQAQLNQLSWLVDLGKWSEAETLWRSLPPVGKDFPSGGSGLYAQVNLAQTLIKMAQSPLGKPSLPEIIEGLDRVLPPARILGNQPIIAHILETQGRLWELQGQLDKAAALTNEALTVVPQLEHPEIAYQLLWQLGRIRQAQGDREGAIGHYNQAVEIIASLRGDLVAVNPDVQFSFRSSVEPIYRELVSLLLKEKSPSQDKLKQARQTIEALQLAELDNFFRDACADAEVKPIDEIDPQAAVIYPIILADRLEVVLSIPGQSLRHYSTPKSQAELETIFNRARSSLRRTAFEQERLPLAQEIYDWLIRPAEADLTANGIKTLVFVLDGSLRNLPMAALHDGEQYLIQKYSISLTPGLQLLDPRPLNQVQLKAITAALSEARQGFPALPGVANEVADIAAEIPTQKLLNQEFVTDNLQKQIEKLSFPILHLATHGQFSSNAADTFILTWDGRVNVKEFDRLLRGGQQTSRNAGRRRASIELLVLSACETAAGDSRAALGLAGIAIRSGARSTLATLWQVNDESTAAFMSEFYRQLSQAGMSKAEALRNAQITLLQNPKYQNPYFWAPFVLLGNWE